MTLAAYLPQDRRRALARGESLPDRAQGVVLFADISGFTALTEQLRNALGPRRGAEELTRRLNAVYDDLIAIVERHGGSVIGFAGDAITCWFDERDERRGTKDERPPTAARAVACGLVLQEAMSQFPELSLKVAITSGAARRFVVGDPEIQILDALAGATVARVAAAERLANQGEVLADEATLDALGAIVTIGEWRDGFGVVSGRAIVDSGELIVDGERWALAGERARPYILPAVYEREMAGQGAFLTEFRPCAALFIHFDGIDYDGDEAQSQLDAFIRQVQAVASRYEGHLLNLTIGDKGSYVYLNLGALIAHEDDGRRALKTAVELRQLAQSLNFLTPLQIGVTQGMMRVGAYGGPTRRVYSALGSDVNLAARLMQAAAPGEILVNTQILKGASRNVMFEPRSTLQIKGKVESLPTFAFAGERQQKDIRLQEPAYALPMIGRENELRSITEKLDLTLTGRAQIIGIVAEAGMGKSRLVAEAIRLARHKGFVGYGGGCQSDGIYTPYLAWKPIWGAFFSVDPAVSLTKQINALEVEIANLAPHRLPALSLLGPLLNLTIPDVAFTQTLEPKVRQSALHALLEDCLKAAVQEEPTIIVIEDLHWIDVPSLDLLDELSKALDQYPVCFILAYRPPELQQAQLARLEMLPSFTKIELSELSLAEARQAIQAKLSQLYPAGEGSAPAVLIEKLMARAQGNPFYLEELLNFLRDRDLDPGDPAALEKLELPDSLHTLILSRIDQLDEQAKTTLRVACIIGRLFRARWLTGYYPELGEPSQVEAALDQLAALDITPLDSPEPELAYLFRHIITHEATYESLSFAARARLHERLARYLESVYADAPPLEALAFHYGRSDNVAKQSEYLRKAGEAAQKNYANSPALAYYEQLLPLLEDTTEKIVILMKRGAVLELIGEWGKMETDYQDALALAQRQRDGLQAAGAQLALGRVNRLRGDYDQALTWLAQAQTEYDRVGDRLGLAKVWTETGVIYWHKAEHALAHEHLDKGIALSREAGDKATLAVALNNLGLALNRQGDYDAAQALFEESLTIAREMSNKRSAAMALNNLGIVALAQGDYTAARSLYSESVTICREIGEKRGMALLLNNLGLAALGQNDYAAAQELYSESLTLAREMADKWSIATSLGGLGTVKRESGDYAAARAIYGESLTLYAATGDKLNIAYSQVCFVEIAAATGSMERAARLAAVAESLLTEINAALTPAERVKFDKTIMIARAALGETAFRFAWEAGERMTLEEAVAYALEETADHA
jgi:adenylate cyclase